jgi:hypothetical protein
MPNIEFPISLMSLLAIIFLALITGYASRGRQIRKKQLKIRELKNQILYNHAHILELQKECVALESKMKKTTPVPVLALKPATRDSAEVFHWVSEGLI